MVFIMFCRCRLITAADRFSRTACLSSWKPQVTPLRGLSAPRVLLVPSLSSAPLLGSGPLLSAQFS